MKRQALADKVMVLGVDGLDPRFARKLMDEGKMPNFAKLAARGAQRHDLVLLGSNPTVTPPQWTTLAVGCNPNVHSITQFFRHNPDRLLRRRGTEGNLRARKSSLYKSFG